MGLKLEWRPSIMGGLEAECGGYTLHVADNASLADLLACRGVRYEWRTFRHSWSTPVGLRGADEPRNTLPTMTAAQEAAEGAAARLLAEDAGVLALVSLIGDALTDTPADEPMRGLVDFIAVHVERDGLRARVAELEAAARWIPVGERLPPDGEQVMLFQPGFVDEVGAPVMIVGWRVPGPAWVAPGPARFRGSVTHWRPLPAGPEVQP